MKAKLSAEARRDLGALAHQLRDAAQDLVRMRYTGTDAEVSAAVAADAKAVEAFFARLYETVKVEPARRR